MGTAYTPGLMVSPHTVVRRSRRLPLKGEVLVKLGDRVSPETVVARTDLPGVMLTVRVGQQLGLEPEDVPRSLRVQPGDTVSRGQVIAESRGLFGLVHNLVRSPCDGQVEVYTAVSGNLGIRGRPLPVERTAYLRGYVAAVSPGEGVDVEAEGAFVQGIFGVGGEREGKLRVVANSPDEEMTPACLQSDHAGEVLVGGALVTAAGLAAAAAAGAAAVVVGGIRDKDLIAYAGRDIGVAITGQESVSATLILTEGFGRIPMASRTFDLLSSLVGMAASVNGATQIRAGVLRPEVVAPRESANGAAPPPAPEPILEVGCEVRLIRDPYFGRLARVTELPAEPERIASGAVVRVLRARLADGDIVTVPRANAEVMVG